MTSRRSDRVAALVQSAVSELLLRETKDPRIGMVTVTGVEMSPDLRHARVFVSALGDAAAHARMLAGLNSARTFLQAQVGKRLELRFTPEMRFVLDPSFETGERIDRLLRYLHPGDPTEVEVDD